jgi:hypothetical protein
MSFFTEIEKSILKFIWKHKRPQIAKVILSKESKSGGITILDFKLYFESFFFLALLHWLETSSSVMDDSDDSSLAPNFVESFQQFTIKYNVGYYFL